mmetsp:Transcript_13771/g.18376  ORF Transcript_13771/g.18376 Transcript_13771/m.18376 type:complete len:502 (+) Transcript_13771:92-1597(+)
MNEVDAYILSCVAMIAFGMTGTLMKLSQVSWSLFMIFHVIGLMITMLIMVCVMGAVDETFQYLKKVEFKEIILPILASIASCTGHMCFYSAMELVGMVTAYPIVEGLCTTLGTLLLYFYRPSDNNYIFISIAIILMIMAIFTDVLAHLQLSVDKAVEKSLLLSESPDLTSTENGRESMTTAIQLIEGQPPLHPLHLVQLHAQTSRSHGLGKNEFSHVLDDEALRLTLTDEAHLDTPLLSTATTTSERQNITQADQMNLIRAKIGGAQLLRLASSNLIQISDTLIPENMEINLPSLQKVPPISTNQNSLSSSPEQQQLERQIDPSILEQKVALAGRMGLWRSIIAGILISFSPFFEDVAILTTTKDLQVITYLAIWTTFFFFVFFFLALPIRHLYLRRPHSTSRRHHFKFSSKLYKRAAFFGATNGMISFLGLLAIFQAGLSIGNTTAVTISRCNPLVAIFFGIIFWRDVDHASSRTYLFISITCIGYLAAVICVALSAIFA